MTSPAVTVHAIHDDADLADALARIEALAGSEPNTPEGDEYGILVTLVAAYEAEHHAIKPSTPARVLRSLMEANGIRQGDLPEIGSQGVVSEILSGKRELNVRQVRLLAKRFRVPAAVFI
jgi:HTH-type transcriptional regulator/antitoxin HigA